MDICPYSDVSSGNWIQGLSIYIYSIFDMINFVNLFLLLFIGFFVFFDIIYGFHYTILAKFYLYLRYFQPKIFNFNKISES